MTEYIVARDIDWTYDDGGRSRYFKGSTGDCVTRAIAIVSGVDYREVYDDLYDIHRLTDRRGRDGSIESPREGVHRNVYQAYLEALGFEWTPTMAIGSGCKTHLRLVELPTPTMIARLSKHLTAVVNGVIHDTHDPSRAGTRCIYGYFSRKD